MFEGMTITRWVDGTINIKINPDPNSDRVIRTVCYTLDQFLPDHRLFRTWRWSEVGYVYDFDKDDINYVRTFFPAADFIYDSTPIRRSFVRLTDTDVVNLTLAASIVS